MNKGVNLRGKHFKMLIFVFNVNLKSATNFYLYMSQSSVHSSEHISKKALKVCHNVVMGNLQQWSQHAEYDISLSQMGR